MSPALISLALLCQATASPWSVNPNNTLLWDAKPYLPIGVRVPGTVEEIDRAAAAGIQDFLIELPIDGTGWDAAFAALEKHSARYTIVLSSAAPASDCYIIEPQAYRRDGLQTSFSLNVPLATGTSVLALLAAKRDGSIRWSQRFPVTGGNATVKGNAQGTEQVLLFYPEMRTMGVPDFWDGFDQHRDILLRSLKQNKPGPGLRGIVNPLGTIVDFPDSTNGAIPSSPLFQLELEARLTERYRTVGNLAKAWAMSTHDITTIRHASRLVPLWSGNRGVGGIWDPKTDKIYTAEMARSEIWRDIREVIASSMDRRMNRLVLAIRQAADVPITQEWAGWDGPYNLKTQMLAGLGGRIDPASFVTLADTGSLSASTVLRRGSGSLMATSIPLPGMDAPRLSVDDVVRESESLGFRGWFFTPGRPEDLVEIATLAKNRFADVAAANQQPQALYFPLGARNPASPSRIPGTQLWWMPSPGDGDRIDFGSGILGYRVNSGREPLVAMWTTSGSRRVKLRAADTKALQFRTIDGSDPDPRVAKKHVEVTLTTSPLLILNPSELPVPEESFVEIGALTKKLIEIYDLRVDAGGEETFQMRENIKVFEQSPGPAYLALADQLRRILTKSAPFFWVEGEAIRNHTFSDIINAAGASAGKAIRLDARLPGPEKGYSLDFSFESREARTMRVWIAGRMSDESAKSVRLYAGAEVAREPGPPVQPYGDGFAWRSLGDINLAPGQNQIRLVADPTGVVDIDAIVMGDTSFQPEGGSIPRQWAIALEAPKPKKGFDGS